ncbi:hypothetical protein AN478_07040 [Thiohalorhabdus denitrificans]|uniref:Fic family protein n=1 Tax=Thiohalorhabdus denitrificans TaxID=381306 RepID=A0A0P9C4M4_9GAMM|nr:Fic family protein [Thiohalorhabdus denitrificans]KPV39943.1 hypothetical protein AN478_07040 [Thiohalorhabdus denitrificans]SCY09356.1 Fic family protein [Thiohalorhabdus denitrificans]
MNLTDNDIRQIIANLGLPEGDEAILSALLGAGEPVRLSAILERVQGAVPFGTRQQLSRRLSALVDSGLVHKRPKGPQTTYRPDTESVAQAYLDIDPGKRSLKWFHPARIEAYIPGETRLLPPEAAEEARALSDASLEIGDTINQTVFRRLMIDTAWSSSLLEGNTYTFGETEDLIEKGEAAEGRSAEETRMIRNHADTVDFLVKNRALLEPNTATLRGLHKLLARDLLESPEEEGNLRGGEVAIARTAYFPSPDLLTVEAGFEGIGRKAPEIPDPYEQAFFLLLAVPYLQPFLDVNKRTGRMAANLPLLRQGLAPLSYFNMDREAYLRGMVEFYELGTTSIMTRVFLDGYRSSVERYRTYFQTIAGKESVARDHRNTIRELVKGFVGAVADGKADPRDRDQFLRKHLTLNDVSVRDRIIIEANRELDRLGLAEAIGHGIDPETFQAYQDRV